MPRTNETRIDDPALIEEVAIAIFENTQGSWEYARKNDFSDAEAITEAVQRNLNAGIYEHGRLSPKHERGVAHFQCLVSRTMNLNNEPE